jgi:CRISPR system Cascade subunit CasC
MFVELHILQNFAPSNLNRDDTNAPKDCEFGGYRRARISSQALKRAMRRAFAEYDLLPAEYRAARTKKLAGTLADRLAKRGRDAAQATTVAEAAIQGMGLKFDDKSSAEDKRTEYLLFLGEREIGALADACETHWDALAAAVPAEPAATGRAAKRAAKASVPKEVGDAFLAILNGGKAADVALFGRMLADLPQRNIDAASQVAHAISTNRVSMEFDFYTAVDDFARNEERDEVETGAGMMGTVEFNSACFYRYANVDLGQLHENLRDPEIERATLEAFVRAAVAAIPTGKQNSMAAQNPPSFVMAVVREAGLWSLANAFLTPVASGRDGDLVARSQSALDRHWGQLSGMYGTNGITGVWYAALDDSGIETLKDAKAGSLDELVHNVLTAVEAGPTEAERAA